MEKTCVASLREAGVCVEFLTATEPDELVFNTDTDEVRHRRKVTFV